MEYRKRCWVKMLKKKKGHDVNERGVTEPVKMYEEGKSYHLDETLSDAFQYMEVAELCEEPKESKDAGGAPENKGSKRNKRK